MSGPEAIRFINASETKCFARVVNCRSTMCQRGSDLSVFWGVEISAISVGLEIKNTQDHSMGDRYSV